MLQLGIIIRTQFSPHELKAEARTQDQLRIGYHTTIGIGVAQAGNPLLGTTEWVEKSVAAAHYAVRRLGEARLLSLLTGLETGLLGMSL